MSQKYRRRPVAPTDPIEIQNASKLVADRPVASSLPHRPSFPQLQQLDAPLSLAGRTSSASSNSTDVLGAARAARGRAVAAKTSVGRSHSHVGSRQTNRGEGKNAASGKPRYSCDVPRSRHDSSESSASAAQLTLVLLGAPRVGKTALVNQFLWEKLIRDYHPTVEEFNWIEYECSSTSSPGKKAGSRTSPSHESPSSAILLQIIDSSGSRDFLAMRHLYCKIGNAFMIVYALNDKTSYAEALLMLKEIEERNPDKNVPILLVANKCDLVPNSKSALPTGLDDEQIASQITTPSNQNVETVRISATNLEQVKQAFNLIIGEMARERKILMQGVTDPFINPNLALHLQKRRQSMPSRRTANDLGIDEDTLLKLMRKHDSHRSNCTIS